MAGRYRLDMCGTVQTSDEPACRFWRQSFPKGGKLEGLAINPKGLKYSDLADPIYELFLAPLSDARDGGRYRPWAAKQADLFILRWLDDPAWEVSKLMPAVKAAAKERVALVHREFVCNLYPIPAGLWPLGRTGAARALLRMRIRLGSCDGGPREPSMH